MVYVDIPTIECVLFQEGAFKHVEQFATRAEAIAFCKEHFGADDEGRVSLVTGGEEDDEPELPFGGSHAPDCPYRMGHDAECLCWRSDPEQNPELADEQLSDEQVDNDIKKALAVKEELERYEKLLGQPLTELKAKTESLKLQIACKGLEVASGSL